MLRLYKSKEIVSKKISVYVISMLLPAMMFIYTEREQYWDIKVLWT